LSKMVLAVCLSVHMHHSHPWQTDLCNWILGTAMKLCPQIPNSVQFRHKYMKP